MNNTQVVLNTQTLLSLHDNLKMFYTHELRFYNETFVTSANPSDEHSSRISMLPKVDFNRPDDLQRFHCLLDETLTDPNLARIIKEMPLSVIAGTRYVDADGISITLNRDFSCQNGVQFDCTLFLDLTLIDQMRAGWENVFKGTLGLVFKGMVLGLRQTQEPDEMGRTQLSIEDLEKITSRLYSGSYTTNDKAGLYAESEITTSVSTSTPSGYSVGDKVFGGIVVGSLNGGDYLLICSKDHEGDSDAGVGGGDMVSYFNWCANDAGDGSIADSTTDGAYNTYQMLEYANYSTTESIFEWLSQYVQGLNGYADWYIPSKDELDVLYQAYDGGTISATAYFYWSSSESFSTSAHSQSFSSGHTTTSSKARHNRVRAVRREQL